MNIPLIFIIFWLALVIIGLIRPKTYLPLLKWQMKVFGKLYGFKTEPQPDEVIFKKIRMWYSVFFIFGLFILFNVLTGRFK